MSQSAAKKQIVIGKAGAPHGIAGEMRVIPLTDFPERFADMQEVYIGGELVHIEQVKYHKQYVLLKLREYPTREDVMRLTGKLLSVDRAQAVPIHEGEYYTFDIIGLEVFDLAGTSLGTISDVLKTGSNDVYVASHKGEAKQILIPALKKVVKEINLADGRMVVDLPEEMA